MGFAHLRELDRAYDAIKRDALAAAATGTVLVLVTPDADSICALKILTALFKSDSILHQIVPVAGYTHLAAALASHLSAESSTEITSVVLLNCGAIISLNDFIPESVESANSPTFYICDAHRPYNLHTLFGEEKLVILDDGDANDMDDLKDAYVAVELNSSDEESNSDSDSDFDSDDDDDENENEDENDDEDKQAEQYPGQASSSNVNTQVSEAGEDGDKENMGVSTDSKKRKRNKKKLTAEEKIDRRRAKRVASFTKKRIREKSERLIAGYYAEGTYFGTSCAAVMYALALQLGKANYELLWLAIIGTTDQYMHQRIDLKKYIRQVEIFKDEVIRFNNPTNTGGSLDGNNGGNSSSQSNELDELLGLATENGPAGAAGVNGKASGKRSIWGVSGKTTADDSTIVADDEFKLMLLRHWSLYEALYHSDYVATKLGIWKEKGQSRLKRFLVKLGLPHRDSQQLFTEMSASYKRSIKDNIKALAPKFNMDEIFFPSFFRQFGFKGTLSAADTVYSINALLDSGAQYLVKAQNAERAQFQSAIIDGNTGREEARSVGLVGLAGVGVGTRVGMAAVHHRAGNLILERVVELSDYNSSNDNSSKNISATNGAGLGIKNDSGTSNANGKENKDRQSGGVNDQDENDDDIYSNLSDNDIDGEEGRDITQASRRRIARRRAWARNFYAAYDALDSYDLLYHGIHLSMMFQKVLMRTGVSILEKKLTQNLRHFHLTVLHGQESAEGANGVDGGEEEFTFFGKNVNQLGRLAKFLMDVYKEFKNKDTPLVIAALDDETNEFTVAGFTGTGKSGKVRKNRFGKAFKTAASQTGADIKFDSFEISVVSVPKDDLSEFLEHLLHLVDES